jgi:transposase
MEKEDARRLPEAEQHQLRKQIVRLHGQGYDRRWISKHLGVSYSMVRTAVDRYRAKGTSGLQPQRRGRRSGEQRSLSAEQEEHIQRMIKDKRPEQLKLEFALWSRVAVRELIERECGVKLGVRGVGKYLKRWGFTPQKPIKKAYEQRPEAVKAWLDEQYPAIAARARAEGGEIHWGDETAIVNTDVRGRSYSPRGETPVTYAVAGTRHKLSMISTVSNQGKARWMIVEENFDAAKLIEFMEALVREAGCKVFLILDNLRVHHSKPVKAWLGERLEQIEVFYLPSYSPELNPDERLNADLKHAIATRVPVKTKTKLQAAATAHMEKLCANVERVKAFFQDPIVRYAA